MFPFAVGVGLILLGMVPLGTAASPPEGVLVILEEHCYSCHEEGTEKGDTRLDNLGELSLEPRLDLLNRMHEKLHFEEMPPKKQAQPTVAERASLVAWVSAELRKHNASKLEDKLRKPEFGNYLDHDKLFSGDYQNLKGFTYDRRWLISACPITRRKVTRRLATGTPLFSTPTGTR